MQITKPKRYIDNDFPQNSLNPFNVALRKLMMIDNAASLNDLRIPPANHLEQLQGDRLGKYSIRINSQYRICFLIINTNDFVDVKIEDYH